eukprot:415990_1
MHSRKLSKRDSKRNSKRDRGRDRDSRLSYSSYIDNGIFNDNNNHNRTVSTQSMRHRNKQPSKQEILLDAEENDNIRDSMAKIFDAFEQAEDNVNRQSLDITNVANVDNNGLDMFSLDNNNQSTNMEMNIDVDMDTNMDINMNMNINTDQVQHDTIDNIINDQYFDNVINSG